MRLCLADAATASYFSKIYQVYAGSKAASHAWGNSDAHSYQLATIDLAASRRQRTSCRKRIQAIKLNNGQPWGKAHMERSKPDVTSQATAVSEPKCGLLANQNARRGRGNSHVPVEQYGSRRPTSLPPHCGGGCAHHCHA